MSGQLKCPACGSDDISALAAGAMRCRHCGTSFAAPGAPTGPVHVHVHAAPPSPPVQYPPPAYAAAPRPQVVYLPPVQKRKTSIVTWAVLGCILFCFGMGIVRLIQVKMQEAERAEAQRVAAIEAGEKVAKALEAAKAQHAAGELEKAVKTLEAIVDDATYLQAENRIEAVKLHEQYGKEYGKRFEAKAAENLAKAREFVKAHKADDALKELDAAIALRYAPQMDELNALRAALLSACDERKMRQVIEAMSDTEFEAFRRDLTFPDRPFFDDADINAIFLDRLKLRHADTVKWREEGKQTAELAKQAALRAREYRVKSGDFGTKDEVISLAVFLQRNPPTVFTNKGTKVYQWMNFSTAETGSNRSWLKLYDDGDNGSIQGFDLFVVAEDNTDAAVSYALLSQILCYVGGLGPEQVGKIGTDLMDWTTSNIATLRKGTESIVKEYGWVRVAAAAENDGSRIGVLYSCGVSKGRKQ